MKLIYITNARIPTEKAHGYQIVKMCEEFAKAGCDVVLVLPERENPIETDIFSFYGLDKNFRIKKIKSYDFLKFRLFKKLNFYLQSIFFTLKLLRFQVNKESVVYTRTPEIAYMFSLRCNKVLFEAHNWPNSKQWLYKNFIKRVDGIIVINKALKEVYSKNWSSDKKILVASDGVDLEKFDTKLTKEDARKKLNLPQDKNIVLYTGNLLRWKGADTLIEAGKFLKDDSLIYIVGGSKAYFKEYKNKVTGFDNIKLISVEPHIKIPIWLKAADILVLPNSGKEKISRNYTSPLKMFEYMASKRPIIASDLPSIREILNERNAVLVKSDSPSFLARAIKALLQDIELSDNILRKALVDVQAYTWAIRAEKILKFIND